MNSRTAFSTLARPCFALPILLAVAWATAGALVGALAGASQVAAQERDVSRSQALQPSLPLERGTGSNSGDPLPRFVTLKANSAFMRKGPTVSHAAQWNYLNYAGLPLLVLDEDQQWRRVRDPWGDEGWMHVSLLQSVRNVMIVRDRARLYREPSLSAPVRAFVRERKVGELVRCLADWCEVRFSEAAGFMRRDALWGVLPEEFRSSAGENGQAGAPEAG